MNTITRTLSIALLVLGFTAHAHAQSPPTAADIDTVIGAGEFPDGSALVDAIRTAVPNEVDALNLIEEAANSFHRYALFEEAINTFSLLLDTAPDAWLTPERQIAFLLGITESYEAQAQHPAFLESAAYLATLAHHHQGKPNAGALPTLAFDYLRNTATAHHKLFLTTRNPRYAYNAIHLYELLGKELHARNELLAYAELRVALDQPREATQAFETFLAHPPKDLSAQAKTEAHYALLLTYTERIEHPSADCPAPPVRPTAMPLPDCHARFLTAADAYLALGSPKDADVVRLRAAGILYLYTRFSAAAEHALKVQGDAAATALKELRTRFCGGDPQGWDGTPEGLQALCGS